MQKKLKKNYFTKFALMITALCLISTNIPLPHVQAASEIIVDNSEADFVGYWPDSTAVSGYYGSNYQHNVAGSGGDTASWSFSIPSAGVWEVFARWTSHENRASNARYTVNHAEGSTVVVRNQELNGGTWVSLGDFSFNSGSYSVVLSDY
ncbi:MAG: hypothetical protein JW702_05565, partial [Clostridiales bacterium]|nr:hypothetical protein [Clostridiales bacterium]